MASRSFLLSSSAKIILYLATTMVLHGLSLGISYILMGKISNPSGTVLSLQSIGSNVEKTKYEQPPITRSIKKPESSESKLNIVDEREFKNDTNASPVLQPQFIHEDTYPRSVNTIPLDYSYSKCPSESGAGCSIDQNSTTLQRMSSGQCKDVSFEKNHALRVQDEDNGILEASPKPNEDSFDNCSNNISILTDIKSSLSNSKSVSTGNKSEKGETMKDLTINAEFRFLLSSTFSDENYFLINTLPNSETSSSNLVFIIPVFSNDFQYNEKYSNFMKKDAEKMQSQSSLEFYEDVSENDLINSKIVSSGSNNESKLNSSEERSKNNSFKVYQMNAKLPFSKSYEQKTNLESLEKILGEAWKTCSIEKYFIDNHAKENCTLYKGVFLMTTEVFFTLKTKKSNTTDSEHRVSNDEYENNPIPLSVFLEKELGKDPEKNESQNSLFYVALTARYFFACFRELMSSVKKQGPVMNPDKNPINSSSVPKKMNLFQSICDLFDIHFVVLDEVSKNYLNVCNFVFNHVIDKEKSYPYTGKSVWLEHYNFDDLFFIFVKKNKINGNFRHIQDAKGESIRVKNINTVVYILNYVVEKANEYPIN